MKKIALLLLTCFLLENTVFTQIIAPDFTLTNTDSVSYSLYDELDSGRVVLLSFFSVSCGSCQSDVPLVEEIYQNNNSSNFTLMSIESYFGNDEQIVEFISTYGGTYTGFSTFTDNHILADSMFNVTYTPQYVVVCPDTSYKKVGIDIVQELIDNCSDSTSSSKVNKNLSKSKILSIFSNDNIRIRFNSIRNPKVRFEIIDLLGNIKQIKYEDATEGKNETTINNSSLNRGYYLLRMWENNYVVDVKKFVIY